MLYSKNIEISIKLLRHHLIQMFLTQIKPLSKANSHHHFTNRHQSINYKSSLMLNSTQTPQPQPNISRSEHRQYSYTPTNIGQKFKRLSNYHVNSKNFVQDLQNKNSTMRLDKKNNRGKSYADFNTHYHTITAEEKWKKIVELYQLKQLQVNQQDQSRSSLEIEPGIQFYRIFLKVANLEKQKLKINFPETIMADEEGSYQMLHTSQQGYFTKTTINKVRYRQIIHESYESFIRKLKQSNKYQKYNHLLDYEKNQNIPFVITKRSPDPVPGVICTQFQIEVQTYRNFMDNRSKPTQNYILQRYVYSRNMKSMIIRLCYEKVYRTQQRQEYSAYRFQNMSTIFKVSNSGNYQIHDLRSTIHVSASRPHTLEHTLLTNKSSLQKYISPTVQLKRILEKEFHVTISKLYVDYMIDLLDVVWLINIKHIAIEQKVYRMSHYDHHTLANNVSSCRLCHHVYKKVQLTNNVSVRMLISFLDHLKKRNNIQQTNQIDFFHHLTFNKKQNAMSAVCECCYTLIIKELELKKYQNILANLCSITNLEDQMPSTANLNLKSISISKNKQKISSKLMQWRLMVYIEDIKNIYLKNMIPGSKNLGNQCNQNQLNQNISIRYTLGKNIEQKWRCTKKHQTLNQLTLDIVKVHYFYSDTHDIEDFLKTTEIIFSIVEGENSEIIAQGSTGIVSTFKNKYAIQCGQRQTSNVLLFFQTLKYCELTLKVGLVADGFYEVPQIANLEKINSVYFPHQNYINSNPLPKQWMEIFGMDTEKQIKELKYEEIFQKTSEKQQMKRLNLEQKTTLKKKAWFK